MNPNIVKLYKKDMKGRSIHIRSPMVVSAYFSKLSSLVEQKENGNANPSKLPYFEKNKTQLESPYLDNKFQHATKHITRNPNIF
jgi:hypothetical protein